ncbi:SIP domain-containing protein [Microterricola viridarii]|uniref:Siderophore-interacting protein n=1 Tax=Microterricola viridarii TaxID=412690 RepID=A0A1H1WHI9_9MICO|nr:SIP domain-containing protein [Microterricola viridarii]SDS96808.1 Siderophore-interacting protein [Microterricola viridarii]
MTGNAAAAHFLLVGDGADLRALRSIVTRLPVNAYGQIYVEVASVMQLEQWPVPAGMTVSWLCRDSSPGEDGQVAAQGELVARAVSAWVAEWMPERQRSHQSPYVLWIGCASSDHVDGLYRELAQRIEHTHFHDPRAH